MGVSYGKSGGVFLRHYPMEALSLRVSLRGMQGLGPPWCCAKERSAQSSSVIIFQMLQDLMFCNGPGLIFGWRFWLLTFVLLCHGLHISSLREDRLSPCGDQDLLVLFQ